jgi:hypothetical protein
MTMPRRQLVDVSVKTRKRTGIIVDDRPRGP